MDKFSYINLLGELPLRYFGISLFLFVLGLCILLLNKDNIVKILIAFELIVLSTVLNFNLFSSIHDDITSQVFVLIILAIAAAEAALGLAIFFNYFKKKNNIKTQDANILKG